MPTLVRTTIFCGLALSALFVGCARRPFLTTATSPPPTGGAAAEAPAAASAEIVTERRDSVVVSGDRPNPATFAERSELQSVYFDFDRYEIRPADAKVLEADAAWLRSNDVRVIIEGQCDERGTDEYNLALGERRARATINYLLAQGIAADRLTFISYGKERPVCTEHTEACWALNRRAHFVVSPRD